MSVLTLKVNEVMRTLSEESSNPFVVHDKEVDIVRFAINSGFADIVLDGQVALRVMYQRPGESQVRAQTLTYYDTDGLRNYYDWHLLSADLAKKGTLTVALCILWTDGEVEEWHTTPCQIRVLDTIHTDDSDEGDETITPTVTERVAVLETMIQRVASGAPIVVSSASAMTDTDQIYVLSTDGQWYYHNDSSWVAGGEYGGVATDTTLTQSGAPADAKVVGDEIADLKEDLNAITDNVSTSLTGTVTSGKTINYLKQIVDASTAFCVSQYDVVEGSSLSVDGCASNYGYLYIFTDENDSVVGQSEQNGSGMKNYSAVETVVPQGAVKIIVASHTSTRYTQAEVTVHELIVKGVEELDGKVSALETLVDDDPAYLPVDVTEKANFFVSGSIGSTPTETTHENWRILSAPVIGGQKYRVSADYYAAVKGVFFTDVNNKIVEIDGEEDTDTLHTIDVTVPPTAIKISINDKKSIGFSLSQIIYPIDNDRIIIRDSNIEDLLGGISEKVAVMSGSSQYTVGTGKMKTVVWLNGSQNGTVAYRNIEYNGSVFKEASDDVTPVQTDAGYVGANHGYYLVYDATLANHGLTESDIGKTCTINSETWVLIKIKSTSVFVVGCVDATSVYGLKAVETAPTQFNFGSSITVTNIARSQLRPSVKNIKVNITKNNAEAFEIAESYDIVLLGDGIDYIIDNVGNNTNDSVIYNSAPAITIRNLYVFGANGSCAIIQNCKMINDDIVLNYYGGTQSGGFGDTDYFAVPMTSYGALASAGVNTNFSRDTWDDNAKPPIIYCQADNTPNSANKMMVQGVVMTDRNDAIYSSAGFIYTTSKMYPYALQPNSAQDANKTYSLISFRMPIYANEISDDFKFCQYCKVLDDYYFFCFSTGVKSASIYVPEALTGRKVETIVAKNALCHNALVTDVIDVTSTGESFLLLKLTR